MTEFYRKERHEIFDKRFKPLASPANGWEQSDEDGVIFKAKGFMGSIQNIKVGGKLVATVQFKVINNRELYAEPKGGDPFTIDESRAQGLLAARERKDPCDTLPHQTLFWLCENHAMFSGKSPFISGCLKNNFDKNTAYAGRKLCLKLKKRQPFLNPFVSGLEAEAFLIGQVTGSECNEIIYLGETTTKPPKDEKVEVSVTPKAK